MIITPEQNVTINGIEYIANSTYSVNYTTFTRMVENGAMQKHTPKIEKNESVTTEKTDFAPKKRGRKSKK